MADSQCIFKLKLSGKDVRRADLTGALRAVLHMLEATDNWEGLTLIEGIECPLVKGEWSVA